MAVRFENLKTRPIPSPMYVDCSIFIAYLDESRPFHDLALEFIEDACLAGEAVVLTSHVIWGEINDAGLKLRLKAEAQRTGDADFVSNMLARPHEIPDEIWDEVKDFSERFETLVREAKKIEIVKAESVIRSLAYGLQKEHRLRGMDAMHAATCQWRNCDNLAVIDRDFHRLGPRIWTPIRFHQQPDV